MRRLERVQFTKSEDAVLKRAVESEQPPDWKSISKLLPGRTPRQCRERYNHYLSPEVNLTSWTEQEDRLLLKKYAEYGKQWSQISKFFNGRTYVQIHNRFRLLKRSGTITEPSDRKFSPEKADEFEDLLTSMILEIQCRSECL